MSSVRPSYFGEPRYSGKRRSGCSKDLEYFFGKLVPENDLGYTHTMEGPDDMPSHIRSALTSTSEQIPLSGGTLLLGTWQGIFLWEHRTQGSLRSIVVHISGD